MNGMRRSIAPLTIATHPRMIAAVAGCLALLTAFVLNLSASTDSAATESSAVFSVKCLSSHQLPDDPIVYPSQPGAAHMHEFIGNPSTNAYSTFESMRAAEGSAEGSVKCELKSDTGGYWVPAMYQQDGTPVPVSHAFFYYRGPAGVAQIPEGLKMIAGGDTLNPPKPDSSQKSLSWSCVDTGPFFAQPPDCSQPGVNGVPLSMTNGLPIRAHIHFPSCWDGVNVDSPDHRSHMAYRTTLACPSAHPVRIPKISFHVAFQTNNGTGTYLSSDHDKPGGTTMHADFWNTWDQAVLQDAVTTCINGNIDCKRLQDNDPRLADGATPTDTTAPTVTSTVPSANTTGVDPTTNVTATFSEDMMSSSINGQTFKLFKKGSTTKLSATVSYDESTDTATLDPNNSLRRGVTYKAVVTTKATDLVGNPLDQDSTATGLQQKEWFFPVSN